MFSIVIPTYRRFESLAQTLDSIRRQRGSATETLIVDQSPEPQASEIRRVVDAAGLGESCRYLRTTPPSSTAARNFGFREARGEWVIFCDDDVVWPDDLIERLTRRLVEQPSLVLVGGLDFEHPGASVGGMKRLLRRLCCQGPYRQDRGVALPSMLGRYPDVVTRPVPTDWAMGYWFAARRDF